MVHESIDRARLDEVVKDSNGLLAKLRTAGEPLLLTVDGKTEAVIQDATAYQRLLALAERMESLEAVYEGLQDADHGRVRSAEKVLEELKQRLETLATSPAHK